MKKLGKFPDIMLKAHKKLNCMISAKYSHVKKITFMKNYFDNKLLHQIKKYGETKHPIILRYKVCCYSNLFCGFSNNA